MTKYGYIRTSTKSQLIDRQLNQLKEYCDEVFIEDGVSAVKKKRPIYDEVMYKLQSGDTFTVLSLDRAFRSVLDALNELDKLSSRNIQFVSLTQNIQSTSPEGRLMLTVIAALAEWERNILSERTKQGIEVARIRGKRIGRPRKLKPDQIAWAKLQIEESPNTQSLRRLSKALNVSAQTLQRALAR